MSTAAKQILEAALKLPPEEREQIVDELAASLSRDFSSKEIEGAWLVEINRRSDELDAGTADVLDLSDVRKRSPNVVPVDPAHRRQRILRSANADMNHAADEYDEARPGVGDEFLTAVESAFSVIFAAPHRWPLIDARHRRFVLRRWPFSIFYRFNETDVVFVAVAHHKRSPAYWAGRGPK